MLYVKVELTKELKESEAYKVAHLIKKIGNLSDEYNCDESWEIKEID